MNLNVLTIVNAFKQSYFITAIVNKLRELRNLHDNSLVNQIEMACCLIQIHNLVCEDADRELDIMDLDGFTQTLIEYDDTQEVIDNWCLEILARVLHENFDKDEIELDDLLSFKDFFVKSIGYDEKNTNITSIQSADDYLALIQLRILESDEEIGGCDG